jgi:hypothetical protein
MLRRGDLVLLVQRPGLVDLDLRQAAARARARLALAGVCDDESSVYGQKTLWVLGKHCIYPRYTIDQLSTP